VTHVTLECDEGTFLLQGRRTGLPSSRPPPGLQLLSQAPEVSGMEIVDWRKE